MGGAAGLACSTSSAVVDADFAPSACLPAQLAGHSKLQNQQSQQRLAAVHPVHHRTTIDAS